MSEELPERTTRLEIYVNKECADYLREQKAKGISATETVRQAISLHKGVEDGAILIVNPNPNARGGYTTL